jgi:translation initiation factor 2 alpha subunit (eIF-2alpha)
MAKSKENNAKEEVQTLIEYNFPAYEVTVLATDLRDAENQLQALIKNNSK